VIYGAGGSIGGAVAAAFAREGAAVFFTGRRLAPPVARGVATHLLTARAAAAT
jgi:NADP-dependent 3-hydroxy acid dehydrogenase YdfG